MSLSTYSELQTFLASFLSRGGLSTEIPDYIKLGEGMIARKVRAFEMLTTYTLTESDRSSGAVYTLPADWLGARAVLSTYEGSGYEVKQKSLAELRSYSASAPPFHFATYGFEIEFRGTPATDSEFDLIYFARIAALSVTSSNLLLTNHPGLYVHSAAHYMMLRAQDFEAAREHRAEFDAIAEDVNGLAANQQGTAHTAGAFNYGLINARSSM